MNRLEAERSYEKVTNADFEAEDDLQVCINNIYTFYYFSQYEFFLPFLLPSIKH